MELFAFTFTDSGQSLGYQTINVEIEIGDYDNDGDNDLILASQGSSETIEVYKNDGSGVFTRLNQSFPQALPFSGGKFEDISLGVIFSDINNDGYLDIATADAWDGVNIYLNDRNGYFLVSQLGVGGTEGIEVKGVDLGDIDNDGDLDLIFGGHQYFADNEVWINDGNGIFSDSGERHYSEAIWHLALGDLDLDGDLDYVWASRYTEQFTTSEVYLNNGIGKFTNSNQSFVPNGNSFGIVLRDVDNDGDLDFIEPNDAGNDSNAPRVRIFSNDGSGMFSNSGQNLGGLNAKDADLGDLDNDGNYDMVVANWLSGISLLINNGNGVFNPAGPNLALPLGSHACKLGDLDSDGDLDLVVGNLVDNNYRVYVSDQDAVAKNTLPSPPDAFQKEISDGKVTLAWNRGADKETNQNSLTYNLRLGKPDNPNKIISGALHHSIGNMGHALKKYVNNLEEGDYIWSVQTIDTSYSRSDWSDEQSLTVNTPTSPTDLQASVVSKKEIKLHWVDKSSIETGFSIERKDGEEDQPFRQIGSVGADTETFSDTDLQNTARSYYRVRAFNNLGNSTYSNEVLVETMTNASNNDDGGGGGAGCFIGSL